MVRGEDYDVKEGKKGPTARDRARQHDTVLEGLDWSKPDTAPREWLRDFGAELLGLYDRLQQAASPGTPSTAANGARTRHRITPATSAAPAKSQGPAGTHGISPTRSADPLPEGETTGPLAVGMVLNGRYR